MNNPNEKISAVILAGGQARRMQGQDKGLLELNGKMMIEYILSALSRQASRIIINANRNLEAYASFSHEVIPDKRPGFCGPLAGIATAMEIIETPYLLVTPCDSPFIIDNLSERLYNEMQNQKSNISVAHDGIRLQPVFCLLRTDLLESLNDFLDQKNRKIDAWFKSEKVTEVDFSDALEMFININTPEDISKTEQMMKSGS